MALIIENGTNVPTANSYATLAEFRSYAQLRGLTIPASDIACQTLLIKAMDYLESLRDRFQGNKTYTDQPLQWPRANVWLENRLVGNQEIPREIVYGQLALAYESQANDLQPNRLPSDKGSIKKEKVEGVGEFEYDVVSDKQRSFTPAFSKPLALLSPLFKKGGLQLIRS